MPYTFNGCGTMYYRRRDVAEDGCYVATLWITGVWTAVRIPKRKV